MIPYDNLHLVNTPFVKEFQRNLNGFFEKGWYVLGEQVEHFEKEYASYCGTKYCLTVASGLDAMIIALAAYEFEKGSEIIVASNTYIATILAILRAGCKPILVEPDLDSYNIDPDKIEAKITTKTKAILITHMYGNPCQMDKIIRVQQNYNLVLFEDCAQAHGAMFCETKVGSFGIGCHSFYPTKNLGCLGDGGAITFDDQNLYDKIRALRNYGSNKKYYNDYVGYNSRLDEIQALFLRTKLKSLDTINTHKINLANIYKTNLKSEFIMPQQNDNMVHVYHIFNIRNQKRDYIKLELLKKDIQTEIHYPLPPHKQKAYTKLISGHYPISEIIHDTTLSLPISTAHNEDDIIRVVEVLNAISL